MHERVRPRAAHPLRYHMTVTPKLANAASFVTSGMLSISACAASIRSNGSLWVAREASGETTMFNRDGKGLEPVFSEGGRKILAQWGGG